MSQLKPKLFVAASLATLNISAVIGVHRGHLGLKVRVHGGRVGVPAEIAASRRGNIVGLVKISVARKVAVDHQSLNVVVDGISSSDLIDISINAEVVTHRDGGRQSVQVGIDFVAVLLGGHVQVVVLLSDINEAEASTVQRGHRCRWQ